MGASTSSMGTYPGQRPSSSHSSTTGGGTMQPNPAFLNRHARQATTAPPSSSTRSSTTNAANNPATNTPAANIIAHPGAYTISRNSAASDVFRVQIPQNIRPGTEFQVYAGSRIVRVRCPPNARSGQNVRITVPPEDVMTRQSVTAAVLTSADDNVGGGAVRMNSETRMVNTRNDSSHSDNVSNGIGNENGSSSTPVPSQQAQQQPRIQAYNVTVPSHARPGKFNFYVMTQSSKENFELSHVYKMTVYFANIIILYRSNICSNGRWKDDSSSMSSKC